MWRRRPKCAVSAHRRPISHLVLDAHLRAHLVLQLLQLEQQPAASSAQLVVRRSQSGLDSRARGERWLTLHLRLLGCQQPHLRTPHGMAKRVDLGGKALRLPPRCGEVSVELGHELTVCVPRRALAEHLFTLRDTLCHTGLHILLLACKLL